jgi:hypothetical protein
MRKKIKYIKIRKFDWNIVGLGIVGYPFLVIIALFNLVCTLIPIWNIRYTKSLLDYNRHANDAEFWIYKEYEVQEKEEY